MCAQVLDGAGVGGGDRFQFPWPHAGTGCPVSVRPWGTRWRRVNSCGAHPLLITERFVCWSLWSEMFSWNAALSPERGDLNGKKHRAAKGIFRAVRESQDIPKACAGGRERAGGARARCAGEGTVVWRAGSGEITRPARGPSEHPALPPLADAAPPGVAGPLLPFVRGLWRPRRRQPRGLGGAVAGERGAETWHGRLARGPSPQRPPPGSRPRVQDPRAQFSSAQSAGAASSKTSAFLILPAQWPRRAHLSPAHPLQPWPPPPRGPPSWS